MAQVFRYPLWSIVFGVAYGILMRVLFALHELNNYYGIVTISFLFLVPATIGAIRVYDEGKRKRLSVGNMIVLPWAPTFLTLLCTAILLLEGSICIVMALPAFMLCSSLGGILVGLVQRHSDHGKNTLNGLLILPLVLSPLEVGFMPLENHIYTVSSSVIINAPADKVWQQLGDVPNVQASELGLSFSGLIGIPRPLSAKMSGSGVDAVRTSTWDKGVIFQEVITQWQPNQMMAYDFKINPDIIPDGSLDEHVKMGGRYFAPLNGSYELKAINAQQTLLTLTTTIRDSTPYGLYSEAWGRVIFNDFHHMILKLVGSRAVAVS